MRKLILSMRISLDGFAAGPEGDLGWMSPTTDAQWKALFDLLDHTDLLLLGGGMWAGYRDYWSSVLHGEGHSEYDRRYARYAERTQHLIFSATLRDAGWPGARIENGDAAARITSLKEQSGGDMQIVGGAQFAATLIDSDLVDEYRLEVNPVLLGSGKPLFPKLQQQRFLRRTDVLSLDNGVTVLTLVPAEGTPDP